jgi:hypothetical protein
MEPLLDPATMAIIRAEPETPVETIVFNYQTSRDFNPECPLYYTPTDDSTSLISIQKVLSDPTSHPNEKAGALPQLNLIF